MQNKETPLPLLGEGESPRLDPGPVFLGNLSAEPRLWKATGVHKPLKGLDAKEICSSQLIDALHTEGLRTHWASVKNTRSALLPPSQSAGVGSRYLSS